jgi:WD40 repeat protein
MSPMVMSITGHAEPIVACAFSPDGRLLATASYDGDIRFWEVETCSSPKSWLAGFSTCAPVLPFNNTCLSAVSHRTADDKARGTGPCGLDVSAALPGDGRNYDKGAATARYGNPEITPEEWDYAARLS